MLSIFLLSKTSEPAKLIALSKSPVCPTNALFFNLFMRSKAMTAEEIKMSSSDTTLLMPGAAAQHSSDFCVHSERWLASS